MLDDLSANTTNPTQEPLDVALIAAQRRYGICSAPDCDQPIATWCIRCRGKRCSRHVRLVQLAPDYRTVILCSRCAEAASRDDELIEDHATLTIRRPAYDPHEEAISEAHAAWWLAACIWRYIRLAASDAPDMLLDREIHIIEERVESLRAARDAQHRAAEGRHI